MFAIARKEFQEILPLLVISVVGGLFWWFAHLTYPLPSFDVRDTVHYILEDWAIFAALVAFAAGHGRIGPEFTQGTVAFLDGLPTSRFRVFFAKSVVGFTPVFLLGFFTFLVKWTVVAAPGDVSMLQALPVSLWVAVHLSILLLAHYGAGIFLSWFGTLGWATLFTFTGGMLVLTIFSAPIRAYYPLMWRVVDINLVNGWPTGIRFGPLFVWSIVGFGGWFASGGLFLGPGDRLVKAGSIVGAIVRLGVVGGPGCLLMILGSFSGLGLAIQLGDLFASVDREDTEHFRFLIRTADRAEGQSLLNQAEDIRSRISTLYGHPGPERLDIELTGVSNHYEGVTVQGKIQMHSSARPLTLAHELSHAWSQDIRQDSGGASAWRFYEEGLATWAESVMGEREAPSSHEVAWRTGQTDWLLLFADGRRTALYDPDQVYPLGAIWADALDEVGGAEAPTCVVRAWPSVGEKMPEADGLPRWYAVLDQCGMKFGDVVAAYDRRVTMDSSYWPDEGVQLTADGGTIVVTTSRDDATMCRWRASPTEARSSYQSAPVVNGSCDIPRWMISGTFEFQQTYLNADGGLGFAPWHILEAP